MPRSIVAPLVAAALLLGTAAPRADAQSLPGHRPLNPLAAARSPLGYQPVTDHDLSGSRTDLLLEYGNAIDYSITDDARYLLDAELSRITLRHTRELGPRWWASAAVEGGGRHAGVADGFFEWYHGVIGFRQPEREARPANTYGFLVELADGAEVAPPPVRFALGDARLAVGFRHGLDQQSTLEVTLPTATAEFAGAGVPTLGVQHALRVRTLEPLVWEVSGGVGVAPRHGALSAHQRTLFARWTTGVHIALFGGHAIYGYFYYHSPYYHDTGIPSLDDHELTGDFGWVLTTGGGTAWRIGFTEDLAPRDLGVDLVLKASASW